MAPIVMTQFESLVQRINEAQKVQYNDFIESVLENWGLMNRATSKMDLDDKKMKIDWFILNTSA